MFKICNFINVFFCSKSLFTEESWDDIEEVGEGGAGYDPTAKMEKMGHARQVNYLSKGNPIIF